LAVAEVAEVAMLQVTQAVAEVADKLFAALLISLQLQ
jgi:hypothetical protein